MGERVRLGDLVRGQYLWISEDTAYRLAKYEIDTIGCNVAVELERILPHSHIIPDDWNFLVVTIHADESEIIIDLGIFATIQPTDEVD